MSAMILKGLLVLVVTMSCVDVNASVLHDKARAGDVSFFKSGLDGLDEREPITGQTPLMAACLAGKSGVVDELLRLGADPSIPEKDGYTPSHGVAFQGREQAARVLVKHGIDVDEEHADGYRPLHRTLWGRSPRHLATARVLVKEGGANVDALDGGGSPPSHKALASSWHEMLELLLELGADVNLQAGNGETLLHLAVQNRDERAVTAIVKAGGDPAVKNSDGMSPLDMATQISERLVALMTPREEL
mmetsp:Transcript_824/g.3191  ORF Transcript_824/g.3191 Transcript_824/m.3191 type:complete len:247 (+) Transcript_824:1616-2356(+)